MTNTTALLATPATATFTRRNDLHEDFYEVVVTVEVIRVRILEDNMNSVMDELGLASRGDIKTAILSLENGASRTTDAVFTSETVKHLGQFGAH